MHLMWSSCTRSASGPAGVTMDNVGKLGDGRLVAPVSATTLTPLPAGDLGRLDDVAARAGRRDGQSTSPLRPCAST